MTKSYPAEVRFILCEDIREENSKKLNFLGVFAGDDISVPRDSAAGGNLGSLAIVAIFRNGEGDFAIQSDLKAPNQNSLEFARTSGSVKMNQGMNMVTAYKWVGFKVEDFGEYTFTITLDSKNTYEYKFFIKPAN